MLDCVSNRSEVSLYFSDFLPYFCVSKGYRLAVTALSIWILFSRVSFCTPVITLRYCSTQDTQTRRYDQILVLTHLQEREEIDKQKL